jgi:hypothetical protein
MAMPATNSVNSQKYLRIPHKTAGKTLPPEFIPLPFVYVPA